MLRYLGAGTERIAGELAARFPSARIGRLDRDTASSRERLLRCLDDFARGRLDVLVGTQMVAKGHDFPGVTLVGIICADDSLHLPDFRAAERTFQLIHQVAGRAGRGEAPGTVVVQTFSPESRVIQLAVAGDYERFAEDEIARRRPLRYPPFGRLARVVARGRREEAVRRWAAAASAVLAGPDLRVLGPAPCPRIKVRGLYRYQLIVKAGAPGLARAACARLSQARLPGGVEAAVDVDPLSFM
jgi:primosomal protein N' (replication factor Y)